MTSSPSLSQAGAELKGVVQFGGCMVFVRPTLPSSPLPPSSSLLHRTLTAPTGDDGQLASDSYGTPPVLWHSTNTVRLTFPTGNNGHLMSEPCGAPTPFLQHSTNAVQLTIPVGNNGHMMSDPAGPLAEYTRPMA